MARVPAPKPKVTTKAKSAVNPPVRTSKPGPGTAARETGTKSLRKKELVDRVVVASGVKKKDAKPVVEAMLAEMGAALARGEGLRLLPFGNLKIAKTKSLANGEVLTCKVRRSRAGSRSPAGTLAAVAE